MLVLNSIEEPPSVPKLQGKSKNRNAKGADNDMGVVITEMAKSVLSALAPNSSSSTAKLSQSSSMSPGKIAGLRSQYLQQIRELHQLFVVGALTEKGFSD